jgi:hypothetical protein
LAAIVNSILAGFAPVPSKTAKLMKGVTPGKVPKLRTLPVKASCVAAGFCP